MNVYEGIRNLQFFFRHYILDSSTISDSELYMNLSVLQMCLRPH
jgi:hypothetical protein